MDTRSGTDKSKRLAVIGSHFAPSPPARPTPRPMASSEEEAALAAVPSDSPTMYSIPFTIRLVYLLLLLSFYFCS